MAKIFQKRDDKLVQIADTTASQGGGMNITNMTIDKDGYLVATTSNSGSSGSSNIDMNLDKDGYLNITLP